jgi:ABC-2 type transport system ATP-binding protein
VPAPAILVRDLRKSYGPVEAGPGIDFEVQRGEVFGLLGPNGAGKTTTVEVLEGHLERTSGIVSVLGLDPGGRPRELRQRVGVVLQGGGTYRHLTVRESIAHWPRCTRARATSTRSSPSPGLEEVRDRRTRKLSGGQLRRLDLALALVGDPELGLPRRADDRVRPAARRAAWGTIRSLADLGKTILLTTHYLDEAQALCDRVAIVKDGRVLATGAPAELDSGAARYRVSWRGPDGEVQARETPTRPRCCTSSRARRSPTARRCAT